MAGLLSAEHDGVGVEDAYDAIVVGAGAAGCVIAARLSEDGDRRVLLIEAGPAGLDDRRVLDPTRWVELAQSEYDWHYAYEPSEATLGRSIPIPRGRVLGGSTSTNALMWYRGHPDDYDVWERAGATGWNFERLLPYFRRSEDWEHGASATRGQGGAMRIEQPHHPHPIAKAMLDGMAELGHPVLDDLNGPSMDGAAYSNFIYVQGAQGPTRWSAARGYLEPALERPNLTVLTDSLAERVEIGADGAVTGVVHRVGGRVRTTRADSVILTLGAIGTPALLLRSGIGPEDELAALEIAPTVIAPGVGQNLQDHPLLMGVNFRAREPLGPKTDNGGGAMMNWSSDVAGEIPDLHAFVVQGPHAGPAVRERYDVAGDVFAVSPGLMRSKSVGHLRLASADPDVAPIVQPNYLGHPDDLAALSSGLEFVLDLAETTPYRRLISAFAAPDRHLNAREREEFVRMSCDTFFHTCGTARMGSDDESVVDERLAVRGASGLFVADASVIPVIPSCNTMAPVIAIAERFSDLYRGVQEDAHA